MVGPTLRANFVAPIQLLSAMAASPGCRRLVLIGSCEEPSATDAGLAVPSSPYAASKFAQSTYATMFHRLYGTPVTVARVCMVYGPEQQDARKFVPSVTLGLLRGDSPKMSSGVRRVDWVYAGDVADGLAQLAVTDADVNGQVYDVGSGGLETVRSVAERIAAMIPDSAGRLLFGAIPDRPLEQEHAADISATNAAIGWRPRVELEEGLRKTVGWYREHRAAFA
jgi:nucleoside-diphosphate-sugar epimerase